MQPHSLGSYTIAETITPAQRKAAGGWAARHNGGRPWPKGTVLPETQVPACPRVKVADLPEGFLKQKYFERLEHDQTILSCCRHPENHDVSAFKSHPDEQTPDQYYFHCVCGKTHKFFCVGKTDDNRPTWSAS